MVKNAKLLAVSTAVSVLALTACGGGGGGGDGTSDSKRRGGNLLPTLKW